MDQKLRTYAERQTDNKGRLMIHPKTTMAINNDPSRDRMSPRSIIWARVKRSRMVDLCSSAPSAIFITMVGVLKNATNVTRAVPKGNGCFECRAPGHFKRDCSKLKNKDGGNGGGGGSNARRTGCSFGVIIGMDWLRRCHVVIVCDEKLVRIPYGNGTLIFCGDESNNGRESRLTIISCSKAQEYMVNGYQIFLAQISAKKEEDKSERKQLKDVPIVQDFSEVFPEDLPGLPLA
ncbi:putative reverse transcriptase domain-containing protein [Tanacetum coccineum]